MNIKEIQDTYTDLPQNDAFEVFDFHRVSYEALWDALGVNVVRAYYHWMYETQK